MEANSQDGGRRRWICKVELIAYMGMMMRFAKSRAMTILNSGAAITGFDSGRCSMKEYDEKMTIQIYKSLMLRQSH